MICDRCGTDNRAGRRFCRACGAELAAACAVCGAANEPGDRFCGTCGSSLPGGQTADGPATASAPDRTPSPAGPDGHADLPTERRLVSVLFLDLVGFTTLAADRDAEAVRDLLGRYFDLAREIIERHGGAVEKFIGDAVMAVWGTPTAHEDDAERAVRAALELVEAVSGIEASADGRLAARAGVLTGEAAVTLGAKGQGMVAGDLVNTASRLQSIAPAGEVLAGEATVRATESSIVYEAAGAKELRGKAAPVPAWRAIRVVAGRRGAGRSTRLEPPFVGRDDELRLLKEMFHATAREGRPRLISITGIAGIGKSRLAWELEKYLDGLADTVYWHQGRSPAYGEGLAFWALGEMVRGRARIAETDDPSTARAKLRDAVATFVTDAGERAWVETQLAVLLGLEPASAGGAEELFAAWRTLFERIADHAPTILVFEEIHWADAALLDFVEALVARARNRPILVVTLGRPELLEHRPTWGAGQRSFTSLDLEPLEPHEMEELLVGLVPGLPQAAIRAIRDRAEGVPLYAVETVRMLLDQGRLTEQDGRYRVAGALGSLAIPDTLSGLVGARLDALPDDERDLLGHAAVLGHSFTRSALAALTGRDDAEVAEILDRLERRELVLLDVDQRSPERGQHRFVQGLLRDVAHGRLSRRERLARHLAAARYFEAQEDDELAGVVASHYADAYRAAPDDPERADLAERARRSLALAADRALDLHAEERAVGYLEEAAEITADPIARRELLERAADAVMDVRAGDEGLAYARRVLELLRAEPTVDGAAVARSHWRIGRTLIYAGRPHEAVQELEDGLTATPDPEGTIEGVRIGSELARAHMMSGDTKRGRAAFERFIGPAEALGDRTIIAELLVTGGWAIGAGGANQEAIALLRGAVVLAERDAPPATRFRGAMNLTAHLIADDPRATLAIAREHAAAARRLGYLVWAQSLSGNASDPALWTGEWQLVEELARDAAEDEVQGIFRNQVDLTLAVVRAFQGRADDAMAIFDAAVDRWAGVEDPQVRLAIDWSRMVLDLVLDARTPSFAGLGSDAFPLVVVDSAVFATRAALWSNQREIAVPFEPTLRTHSYGGRWIDALRAGALGALAAMDGDPDAAVASFDAAVAALRSLGVDVDLALVLVDRVVALPDAPGRADAEAELRAICRRLGARGLEQRFEQLVGGERVAPRPRLGPLPTTAG